MINYIFLFFCMDCRSESFSTLGKRPFAPRTASDIHVHDIVKFARQGGRICRGLVKFIGHLPGRNDTYLGVELDKDGKFNKGNIFMVTSLWTVHI